MRLSKLVTWITFAGLFAMAARVSLDTDTWWHLRTGAFILEFRQVPSVDVFSYTRLGEAWPHPGWLVQVPLAWMYQTWGPAALNLWVAVMVCLAFAFTWRAMPGNPFLKAFVTILAAATAGVYWAARPYMVTFVFVGAFLWILEDFRNQGKHLSLPYHKNGAWDVAEWQNHLATSQGPISPPSTERRPTGGSGELSTLGKSNQLSWLPILMILWVNCHGGFAAGFLIWGAYLMDAFFEWFSSWMNDHKSSAEARATVSIPRPPIRHSKWFRLLLVGLGLCAAVTLNPTGVEMLFYPFKTVGIEALQDYIQEWQSPNFHNLSVQPFAWLLLLALGAVGASRRGLAWVEFFLVAGFAYLSLLAGRNIALFALTACIPLATHADIVLFNWGQKLGLRLGRLSGGFTNRKPTRFQSRLNWFLWSLVVFAALAKASQVLSPQVNQKAIESMVPVRAVNWIRAHQPAGRLFNSYNWGSYLLWALPEYPVFIDGRTDLYTNEVINEWFQVARAEPGWADVLNRWQVNLVLLEPNLPIIGALKQAGWEAIYADDQAVILTR